MAQSNHDESCPSDFHRWVSLAKLTSAQQQAIGAAELVKAQAAHCREIGCSETRINEAIDRGNYQPNRYTSTS